MDLHAIVKWYQNKNKNPITNKYIKTNGPLYNKFNENFMKIFPNGLCVIDSIEDRDPISLEIFWIEKNGIKEIVYENINDLILYKEDNIIHCFEKNTIKYMKQNNLLNHPITMKPIPQNILNMFPIEQPKITLDSIAMNIFTKFTEHSVFIDYTEFINLGSDMMNKLYYETQEFYNYNIPHEHLINIKSFEMNKIEFNNMNLNKRKKYILECYEKLLNYNDIQHLCICIMVGGLGIILESVKENYPDICYQFNI